MLYNQAVEEFLNHMEITDKSKQTIMGYEKELRYMNNYLMKKYNCPIYMEDITLEDMESYLQYKKKKGIAPSSRNRAIYIFRSFYKYCHKRGICDNNLPNMLEPVKVNKKERSFITEEEFEDLVNAINKPVICTIVQTMFYTGGRISEILNLKINDVDLEEMIIHIIGGKGNKDRNIPINHKLYKILNNYICNIRKVNVETDKFFANRGTGMVSASYVNKCIQQAANELGWKKKISSHILRHSFGTNLLDKGASLVSIQKLLGHANLAVTSIYLHQDIKKLDDAVNLL